MSPSFVLALWFLLGGGALALVGLILWHMLLMPLNFPPYLATATVAIFYGLFCLGQSRRRPSRPS